MNRGAQGEATHENIPVLDDPRTGILANIRRLGKPLCFMHSKPYKTSGYWGPSVYIAGNSDIPKRVKEIHRHHDRLPPDHALADADHGNFMGLRQEPRMESCYRPMGGTLPFIVGGSKKD